MRLTTLTTLIVGIAASAAAPAAGVVCVSFDRHFTEEDLRGQAIEFRRAGPTVEGLTSPALAGERLEVQMLLIEVIGLARNQLVDALPSFSFTAEEVQSRTERFRELFGESIDTLVGEGALLAEALNMWRANPDQADEIYRTHLIPLGITREEWEHIQVALAEDDQHLDDLVEHFTSATSESIVQETVQGQMSAERILDLVVSGAPEVDSQVNRLIEAIGVERSQVPESTQEEIRQLIRQARFGNQMRLVALENTRILDPAYEAVLDALLDEIVTFDEMCDAARTTFYPTTAGSEPSGAAFVEGPAD